MCASSSFLASQIRWVKKANTPPPPPPPPILSPAPTVLQLATAGSDSRVYSNNAANQPLGVTSGGEGEKVRWDGMEKRMEERKREDKTLGVKLC